MQPELEIWLDMHISPIIAKWLKDHTGFQVKSGYILEFHSLSDNEIYKRANEHGNVILLSKDADFPELISRLGSPPKLINIKIGNCDNRKLWAFIQPNVKKAIEILVTTDIDIIELD